jgi:hypothetical protein
MGNGALSQVLKQPQREADRSASSSAKFRQNKTTLPLHHLSYWHAHGRVLFLFHLITRNLMDPRILRYFSAVAL